MTVSPDEVRSLFRAFPAGVAIVAVDANGQRVGLTVGSLVPLSLAPPLVGVAVNRISALHELLREARAFGVSLLAADQAALAQHFARGVPPIAMWTDVAWHRGATGAPLLDGALGWLDCSLVDEHPTGDHTLFVGEVATLARGDAPAGLLYVERAYRAAPA